MEPVSPRISKTLLIVCGITFAAPCVFFAQFTVRLIYRNLILTDAATYETFWGMVWAIFFPTMTLISGLISWNFFRMAKRIRSGNPPA